MGRMSWKGRVVCGLGVSLVVLFVSVFFVTSWMDEHPKNDKVCATLRLGKTFNWELDAKLPENRGISTYLSLNGKEQRPPVDGQEGHATPIRKPDSVGMRIVGWQETYGSGGLKSLPGGGGSSATMCAYIDGRTVTKVTTTYYGVDPSKEVFFNKLTINGKYFEDPQGRFRAGSPTKTYTPDISAKGELDWEVKELGGQTLAEVSVNLGLITSGNG